MSSFAIDPKNSEFMLLAKAGDFRGAHKSLALLAKDTSMTPASLAGWQSHLHQLEGNVEEASRILDPHISIDDIPGQFLRHQRARLFLWNGRLDEARADLEALLCDERPRIAALHSGCRVQLAYIFAMQGDPEFGAVFEAIPDGRDYFIKDSIVGKDELYVLYRANAAKTR